ncbi:MAG: integrase family protein [Paenibacillus sp.]|nr:integrase family protein [Paenibacillus sp.]
MGKGSELSSKTVAHHHMLISSVLTTAVHWGVIISNPADRCKPPKVEKKQLKFYDEGQVVQMLRLLENEPLKLKSTVYLAIDSGIRNGELVGLTWSNVDFQDCRLYIEQQRQYVHGLGTLTKAPKTTSGVRHVTVSEQVMKSLRSFKVEQMENRLKFGTLWKDTDLVFVHEDGSPMHPHRPYKMFTEFLEKNNLPPISFHALRHTNASLLIAQGVDAATAMLSGFIDNHLYFKS